MAKPRKHRTIIYTVELDLQTHSLLRLISAESHRPIPEIIAMAARLFRASSNSISAMHPPARSARPLTPAQRQQHIARTNANRNRPASLARILTDIATNKKETES